MIGSSKLSFAFSYSGDPETFVIVITVSFLHEAKRITSNKVVYFS